MKTGLIIHPQELSAVWIDDAARIGLDALGLHPVGGPEADRHLADLLDALQTPAFRALLDAVAARGIQITYELHALRWLLPQEEFAAHPEWFRMDETGARNPDFNYCPSCEEGLAFIARRACELAKRLYRSDRRYFFWPDDVKGKICRCPRCAGLSASDQQLLMENAVITALRRTDPQAELAYLAYQDSLTPPTVKPEAGIFLEYAPIERGPHTPLTDPACADERRNLQALIAHFGKHDAKVLGYWLDNSLFSGWKKPPVHMLPDTAVMDADFACYTQLGFADITSFACYLGDDYRALYGPPDLDGFIKK